MTRKKERDREIKSQKAEKDRERDRGVGREGGKMKDGTENEKGK